MRVLLLFKLVLITAAAVAIVYFAVGGVGDKLSGLHSTDVTDAELIRQRYPVRLVQPEWVSSQPDWAVNWVVAEISARLGLVAGLWLVGVGVSVSQYSKKRKNTQAG